MSTSPRPATRGRVLVIPTLPNEAWGARLTGDLERLGARAAGPRDADAVAVVLVRASENAHAFALPAGTSDADRSGIREALDRGIPVVPVLAGAAHMPRAPFDVPSLLEALRFRVALPLPDARRAPEVAAQLVAAALYATPEGREADDDHRSRATGPVGIALPPALRRIQEGSVFVSYRRDDTSWWATELSRELAMLVGPERVFFDVGRSSPGADFRDLIHDALAASFAVAVVVGSAYLEADAEGRRRLDDPDDWVRTELRTALEARLPLHLVLVGSAAPPAADLLPADIRDLARAPLAGSIRTGQELDGIVAGILGTTRMGHLLGRGPGGSRSSVEEDLGEVWRVRVLMDGLDALGWHARDGGRMRRHGRHPDHRFEVRGGDGIAALEERTDGRWRRRAIFSMTGSALEDTGVMQLERRLVEAAVHPGAFLDRVGRETLPPGKPEWPAGLDPLHYATGRRRLPPLAIERWHDTREHVRAVGGLPRLDPGRAFVLEERAPVDAAFLPDGRIVVLTRSGLEVIETDLDDGGAAHRRIPTRGSGWTALAVAPDGSVALGSEDGRVELFDGRLRPRDGLALPHRWLRALTRIAASGFPRRVTALGWSASGEKLAATTQGETWILDVASGAFSRIPWPERRAQEFDPSFGSYGAHFLGASEGLVLHAQGDVWVADAHTGEVTGRLEPAWVPRAEWWEHEVADDELAVRSLGMIEEAVPSPEGDLVVLVGSNGQFGLLDPGALLVRAVHAWHEPISMPGNDVVAAAFAPDGGNLAVVAQNGYLVVGDPKSGLPASYAPVARALGPTRTRLAWSRDGRHLLALARLPEHDLTVWAVGTPK